MPKKASKSVRQDDEQERRPQQITLGCFLKEAKPRGKKQNERGGNEQREIKQGHVSLLSTESATACNRETTGDDPTLQTGDHFILTADEPDRLVETGWTSECKMDGFKVMRTKKGGYPIYLEKRAKGKKVTVVRQVAGDSKLLLQTLKTKFGTGGLIKPGEVEIQGDFEEKLIKYFKDNAQLLVQYKSNT